MNALEKLVDLLAACLLMFGLPLLYYGGKTGLTGQMTAGRICESFLSRCSLFGEMNAPFVQELERGLAACGCSSYEVIAKRELYSLQNGELRKQRAEIGMVQIQERLEWEKRVGLLPGDVLSVLVYFEGVPTVYSVTVRSGGARE